jgi:hypothetical protein
VYDRCVKYEKNLRPSAPRRRGRERDARAVRGGVVVRELDDARGRHPEREREARGGERARAGPGRGHVCAARVEHRVRGVGDNVERRRGDSGLESGGARRAIVDGGNERGVCRQRRKWRQRESKNSVHTTTRALAEGRRSNGQKGGADRDAQPARISAREIAGGGSGSGAAGPALLPIAPPRSLPLAG